MAKPMIPDLSSTILMEWGDHYVLGRVVELYDGGGFDSGKILVIQRSHPDMFGGSPFFCNFAWRDIEWVYDTDHTEIMQ